jgi:hypothetical protein
MAKRPQASEPQRGPSDPAASGPRGNAASGGVDEANDHDLPEGVDVKPEFHEIQLAAYMRWLREGGDADGNWAAAEAELWAKLRERRGL